MASKKFSQILKELRIKSGYSQKDVYEHFKIPQSTFSSWEIGKSEPSGEMLIKLCEFYKCDMMKEFSNISSSMFTLNETRLIEKYRALDSHGKEVVDVVLEKETERIEKLAKSVNDVPKGKTDVIYIDFVEAKASAGKGFNLDDEYKEKLKLYVNRTTARADFAVMVAGDSMEPKFYDGDILLVSKQPDIEIGDFGIFVKNDKGYVKEKGTDRLISLNENYPDIFPSEDEPIQCMGKVIGILDKKWIAE